MNDLIQRIVNAIFRQEASKILYNPGNLRGAPWLHNPVILHGFWRPTSIGEGVAGAAWNVAYLIGKGHTLAELISIWAPSSDNNNTQAYIANVANWARIPNVHTPLYMFLHVEPSVIINGTVTLGEMK